MKKQKSMVLLLIFAMALSLLPQSAFAAKKKVKLNKKTVTVNVGKTVKIKLQNNKKKVKWTVTSGKKNVTLSKKKIRPVWAGISAWAFLQLVRRFVPIQLDCLRFGWIVSICIPRKAPCCLFPVRI